MINASEIIKNIYGKLSDKTRLDFEMRIRNLPDEPFIFYPIIKTKDKKGNEILIRVDPKKKDKYPKGMHEITFTGPRFTWVGWLDEHKGKQHKDNYCLIHANPINLANMLGENNQLTNYDCRTPEYMKYNRAIRNDDNITPAVEKILAKEYDKRFPMASIATRTAKKQARENGEQAPDKQTLDNIRKNTFSTTINKDQLFAAVCANAGEPVDGMTTKRRNDIKKKIDNALQLMWSHGVIVETYSTIKTQYGDSWNIRFIAV